MRATGSVAGFRRELLAVEEQHREGRPVEGDVGSAGWRGPEEHPPLHDTWKGQPW